MRSDRLLRLRVYLFAAAVPVLARLRLARLAALLEPRRLPPVSDSHRIAEVQAHVDAVLGSGLPLIRSGCLTRGVTRFFFLRRAGLEVELCFGAGQVDGEFAAHCWLVRGGEPFLETVDPRDNFVVMYRVPPAPPPPRA
jgi:hypothetical protein